MPGTIANQAIYHDQWKRLGFIGKGSYGQVYRALNITSGYIFAVKTVNSKEIKRRTLVQALQDERETLKELEHPNIVRYLGFGEDEGVLNMYASQCITSSVLDSCHLLSFLEYVPGGTIRSCLNIHGKFKEEVTKSFASQILQGLSYLHSKSILHRVSHYEFSLPQDVLLGSFAGFEI
jgi:serine/threonine protein kinase